MNDDAQAWGAISAAASRTCAEFALHESLPVYSGGWASSPATCARPRPTPGSRSSAWDRSTTGGFRQRIDAEGRQEHLEPDLDPADMPLRRAAGTDGAPLEIAVDLPGRAVRMAVWVAQVGRVPLPPPRRRLPTNKPEDRRITDELYVAERRTRLTQELLLGMARRRRSARWGSGPRSGISTRATPPSSCLGGHGCSAMRTRIRRRQGPGPGRRGHGDDAPHPCPRRQRAVRPALALELIGPAAAAIDLSPVRLPSSARDPTTRWGRRSTSPRSGSGRPRW